MNKDKTRALRRHHRERLMHSRSHDTFSGTTEQQLSKHVSTPAKCSCWMCGNPRKYYGNSEEVKTIQERKFG